MDNRTVRPAGDSAVLVEFADPDQARRAHADLTATPVPGITDLVPGATTLLIIAEQPGSPALVTAARRVTVSGHRPAPVATAAEVRLRVRYDGPDLHDVARRCQMSPAELVHRHSGPAYTVAFLGLLPGFAYLIGLDPALRLPRRPNPRTAVPAGALAMASEFTGVYPRPSPGGWHLLGSTTAVLWDLERHPPALLVPGTIVHFDPVGRDDR